MGKATPKDQFFASGHPEVSLRSCHEMVDVALDDWIAYPAFILMQAHIVVGRQELDRAAILCPQLVEDQAFIAT